MSDINRDIDIIKKANSDMLDFFNSSYSNHTDSIQALKTTLFEVNIKLEELNKTKSLYVFNSNSRKNVFSPIISDAAGNEKEITINNEITNLQIQKTSLETKIAEQEILIRDIQKKLKVLNSAGFSIDSLTSEVNSMSKELDDYSSSGFDFIDEQNDASISNHGINILMLDAFEKTYMATMLDKKIKNNISDDYSKLKMLRYLVDSNTDTSKTTIDDILRNYEGTMALINYLLNKLNYNIDTSKPIWTIIDNFVTEQRDNHPECVIETNIDCKDKDKSISYIKTLSLINLLNIFFDNIFKHANANRVNFNVFISDNAIDVKISDNGKGISDNYSTESTWYSSLHRANELIYLLNGNLSISGSSVGTSVNFTFSAV